MQKLCLSVVLVFWSFVGYSQSFQQNKKIKGLDLPSNQVLSIGQDDGGQIWVSTGKGVFYSDGITTYSLPDTIHQNLLYKPMLFKDYEGVMYAYNSELLEQVFYFKDKKWVALQLPESLSGKVDFWGKASLSVNSIGGGKKLLLMVPGNIGFYDFETGIWEIKSYKEEDFGEYYSLHQDEETLYFYFAQKTLKLQKEKFYSEANFSDILEGPLFKVAWDSVSASYYFLANGKLARGKSLNQPEEITHEGFAMEKFGNYHHFDLQVKEGKIFYYFNSHLYRSSPVEGLPLLISAEENLRIYFIQALLVDREDIIWIGSQRGMVNVPTLRFQNYTLRDGLLDNEVTAIHKASPNRFFLGFNNGVQLWQNDRMINLDVYEHLKGTSGNRVNNFSPSEAGIYFSAGYKGVGLINENTLKTSYWQTPDGSPVQYVTVIDDKLYVLAGFNIYQSQTQDKDIFANNVTSNLFRNAVDEKYYIRKIGKLRDGKYIYLQNFSTETIKEGFGDGQHYIRLAGYDYLETDEGLLIATQEGLKVYRNGELTHFRVNNMIIDQPVFSLLKDDRGAVWLGTDKGVYVIFHDITRKFDSSRGLIGEEVNRGAFIRGNPGRVWIGTEEGLSIYRQLEDDQKIASPLVSILNMRILSDENNLGLIEDKIPYDQNNLQIDYQAVSFMQRNNLYVHYRLLGRSDVWETIVDPRSKTLIFDNLPPGDYQLELKASLGGQVESEVIRSSKVTIDQPYYLKPLFIFFVLLLFLALGFILNTLLNQFRNEILLRKTISQKISEIQLAEEQFRNVWNSSKDGLCLSGMDGNIIAVNPAMVNLCGVPAKELKMGNISLMFSDPDFYETQKVYILEGVKSNGKAGFTRELTMPFKTESKTIELYSTLLDFKNGNERVMLTVFRDITEKKNNEIQLRKAKEKAEESNQLKSRFLSNMSHEIRTPLNGILGSAENLIITHQDNPDLLSGLEIILESGDRLLKTINSILDMSKIESRTMETRLEETNINDFISKILMPLKVAAMKKGLLLTAKFETKSFIAPIDKASLDMVINNIVSNAIKYSQKGMIHVKVKQLDHSLYIQVQDEGIGMSEDFLLKIFQPFQQESGGYARKFEGSGLGLSITKSLTDMLKGQIYISSGKGKGTTVTVTIPLEPQSINKT